MLDVATIDKIAARVANATLRKDNFSKAISAPSAGSDGEPTIKLTIVVKRATPKELDGDRAIDLMFELQRALIDAGEERFAIVDFATEQEFREDGGS